MISNIHTSVCMNLCHKVTSKSSETASGIYGVCTVYTAHTVVTTCIVCLYFYSGIIRHSMYKYKYTVVTHRPHSISATNKKKTSPRTNTSYTVGPTALSFHARPPSPRTPCTIHFKYFWIVPASFRYPLSSMLLLSHNILFNTEKASPHIKARWAMRPHGTRLHFDQKPKRLIGSFPNAKNMKTSNKDNKCR